MLSEGTGKSTVTGELARLFTASQLEIKCAAPTGVATGAKAPLNLNIP